MCIMVVEDDTLIRSILVEELIDGGFAVRDFGTGDDAWSALPALDLPLDLLVTDIHMAGALDGVALATRLREERPALPVIFTTGRPDAVPFLASGQRLIRKPYVPDEVIEEVRTLLAA